MKKTLAIILTVTLISTLTACSNNSTDSTSNSATSVPTSSNSSKAQTKEFGVIGEFEKVGTSEILIEKFNTTEQIGKFSKAKDEKQYIVFDIKIKNNDSGNLMIGVTYQLNLQLASGELLDSAIIFGADEYNNIIGKQIASNGEVSGQIAFEVPKNQEYTLIYENPFNDKEQIKYKI